MATDATNSKHRVHTDLAIPPGEMLEEELEAAGMTREQLSVRTGRPVGIIDDIIRGETPIAPDLARALEDALGIPERVWMNLELEYRLTLARLRDRRSSDG